MDKVVYFLLFISSSLAAAGQLLLKFGANDKNTIYEFINIHTISGLLLYFIGLILWIYSLSKVNLILAYPFTLLTFILVFILAHLFLGELINKISLLGILFISFGFFILFYFNK